MSILNQTSADLFALAEELSGEFQQKKPFNYVCLDNFFNEKALSAVLEDFPQPENFNFYKYENPLEKKLAFDQINQLPLNIRDALLELNQPTFLRFLEILSGVDPLIPDPYYRGGGIHQILPNGKLDVHFDFNWHKKLKLDRKLNVICYLNKNWEEEYGGHLEIWNGEENSEGKLELTTCKEKILPVFNRVVIFRTDTTSLHGHPERLTCPEGMSRKSLAAYYYSPRAEWELPDYKSTQFFRRPMDENDPELDALREKRNQGRLSTNVKSIES